MIKSFKRQIVLLLYGKGIYYINGSDNLPPPLSAELEEEYARLTFSGDKRPENSLLLIISGLWFISQKI